VAWDAAVVVATGKHSRGAGLVVDTERDRHGDSGESWHEGGRTARTGVPFVDCTTTTTEEEARPALAGVVGSGTGAASASLSNKAHAETGADADTGPGPSLAVAVIFSTISVWAFGISKASRGFFR